MIDRTEESDIDKITSKGWSWKKTLILAFIGVIVFAYVVGHLVKKGQKAVDGTTSSASYMLSADELYGEYNANEVAADIKYKGKIVKVYGTVRYIKKDIMEQAYVVIGGRGC